MLVKAILIGLVSAWGVLDYQVGTLYTFRPLVLSVIVGAILGDVHQGIIIGANLELLFMGAISVGAYIPPDVNVGGVLATAFAISMGKSVEAAVALAMPIATLALGISNILAAVTPVFLKIADKGAEEGNYKKVVFTHWLMGTITVVEKFLLVTFAFYLGADKIQSLLDFIPQFILDGMGVAAGMLPAMGFAMLLRMIVSKRLIPYFVLGFVLISYANIPVLGIALIALIIVAIKFGFLEDKPMMATAEGNAQEVDDDEDF
ncbi:MAG: PTS mannose/fructose/sorbose/N-acetylgalactosamine transporter subunit IIC [Eubacterium sp.]